MDRESFLETVRKQFADEIHETYLECEHGKKVDLKRLNTMLKKLMGAARAQGLPETEFWDLVKSTLPDHWEDIEASKQPQVA